MHESFRGEEGVSYSRNHRIEGPLLGRRFRHTEPANRRRQRRPKQEGTKKAVSTEKYTISPIDPALPTRSSKKGTQPSRDTTLPPLRPRKGHSYLGLSCPFEGPHDVGSVNGNLSGHSLHWFAVVSVLRADSNVIIEVENERWGSLRRRMEVFALSCLPRMRLISLHAGGCRLCLYGLCLGSRGGETLLLACTSAAERVSTCTSSFVSSLNTKKDRGGDGDSGLYVTRACPPKDLASFIL